MLQRILKVAAFSPLKADCWQPAAPDCSRINLIYGFNGSGKTSLSNCLRLLAANEDTEALAKDLSSPESTPVAIEVQWDGATLRSSGTKKPILVFNSDFVATHVYDGSQSRLKRFSDSVITSEHLTNATIRSLDKELATASSRLDVIRAEYSRLQTYAESLKKSLSKSWNNSITTSRLTNLRLESLADSAITVPPETESVLEEQLESHFQNYKRAQKLHDIEQDTQSLSQKTLPSLPVISDLFSLLATNVPQVTTRGIASKLEQFASVPLSSGTLRDWFADGLALLESDARGDTCPLCDAVPADWKKVLDSYHSTFTQELATLQGNLRMARNELSALRDLNGALELLAAAIAQNASKYDLPSPTPGGAEVRIDGVAELIAAVDALLSRKGADPGFLMSPDDERVMARLIQAVPQIERHRETLSQERARLVSAMKGIAFDVNGAKETALKLFLCRFDKARAGEITGFDGPVPSNSGLGYYRYLIAQQQVEEKQLEQVRHRRSMLAASLRDESKYVNAFLKQLGVTSFHVEFGTADDAAIQVVYRNGLRKRSLRYSLSDGERTALAFAYFLSKTQYELIDNTECKFGEYVIVLDDPVSSLDDNRRAATALLVRRMFSLKCLQLFVLSHDLVFLKTLAQGLVKEENQARTDFYLERGEVRALPRELKNFQTSYFYKLDRLQGYIAGAVPYEEARDYAPAYVRMVLESFLAFKFCVLNDGSGIGRQTSSAGLERLIHAVEAETYPHHEPVGEIHGKDDLVEALWEIKRQVDPDVHGTTQDVGEFEYQSDADLRRCCELALDAIRFLDRIHLQRVAENGAGQPAAGRADE